MRGVAIRAGIAAAVAIGGFAIAVAVLNGTLFSASGFVREYLDALQRQDAATALTIAGDTPATSRRTDLLVDAAIAPVTVTAVTESAPSDGITEVDVEFSTGTGTAGATSDTTSTTTSTATFQLMPTGALFGLFTTWAFVESPLATVELTVLHSPLFTANGIDLVAPAQDEPVRYLVFAPSVLQVSHESTLLTAAPQTVVVGSPGRLMSVELDAQANDSFVQQVQAEVDNYLAECATQQVLMPSGCPFGQEMADRIVSPPAWSLVTTPAVTLEPTATAGEWTVPTAPGVAHLVVDVKSIYDGEVSTFDENVPFMIGFTVTFVGENSVVLTPRG